MLHDWTVCHEARSISFITGDQNYRLAKSADATYINHLALLFVFSALLIIMVVEEPWWLSKASVIPFITEIKTELSIFITLERFLANLRAI